MKIVLLAVAALLAGFYPAAAAFASAPSETEPADNETAAEASPRPASVLSLPPTALLDFGMRLIGTAVVDHGSSVAVIQFPNGTRYVREGEELTTGMRLVKVRRDRIDFERAGVVQDMRARSGSGPILAGESSPIPVPANVDPAQLWQTHGRLGRSMFYSHYRRN